MRIRTRLVALLSAAVVGTTGLASWLSIGLTRSALEDAARIRAIEVAEDISVTLARVDPEYDEDDIGYQLEVQLRSHPELAQIEFSDPGGTKRQEAKYVLWYDQPEAKVTRTKKGAKAKGPPPQIVVPPPPIDLSIRPLHVVKSGDLRDIRLLEMTVPVKNTGSGKGQLVLRFSLAPIDHLIATLTRISALVTLAALVVVAGLAFLISERVVGRRLRRVTEAMHDIESGDLSRRVEEAGKDEVSELSRGFNRMIAQVSEADTAIRAFNERLAAEIHAATQDLAEKHEVLAQLNRLLVEARRQLGDKERLAALGQLAAQLAHEIGTPLSSVSGHLQLATARADCPQPVRERLGIAGRELERVSKIIRDYLDSTRPMAPELREVATEQLLREAVEIARKASAQERVPIELEVAPDAARLVTDPGLLRQIAINLLTNALDAVDPGRGKVELAARRRGDQVVIGVRDNGHGIGAAELARVFEPFYTTKGRGKGTGLGLAICRELAVSLGGKLQVESEPGAGSHFTLLLPARTAGGSKAEAA